MRDRIGRWRPRLDPVLRCDPPHRSCRRPIRLTGPVSGEPVRGGIATRARTRDDVSGILVLLALGLTFRVIIAYLLPGSGFANDIGAFQYWAANLAREGLNGFYSRPFFHDYTPGYLYVLWLVGAVGQAFGRG